MKLEIEHPTPEEIEEIDSKQIFMKIIKELKQEVKISRKEMKDRQDLPRATPWHSEPGLWAQSGRGSSCALRTCLAGRP